MVILLIALQSTHMCHEPSFLGTKITGIAHTPCQVVLVIGADFLLFLRGCSCMVHDLAKKHPELGRSSAQCLRVVAAPMELHLERHQYIPAKC
jgi:hypothetical protein